MSVFSSTRAIVRTILAWSLSGLRFVLLLPVIALVLVPYLLYSFALYCAIWLLWCSRGRFVLVVYSDSPIWRDYFQSRILPRVEGYAVILNWSERRMWQTMFSLPVMAFHHFGGQREFNPLAVVFQPFRRAKTFRFWRAFKELKHEKPEAVQRMEAEFLGAVNSVLQQSRG